MVSFDRDKLSLVAATFFSTLVMAVSFYLDVAGITVATRVSLTFTCVYAAVAIFAYLVEGIIVREAVSHGAVSLTAETTESASQEQPTVEATEGRG